MPARFWRLSRAEQRQADSAVTDKSPQRHGRQEGDDCCAGGGAGSYLGVLTVRYRSLGRFAA